MRTWHKLLRNPEREDRHDRYSRGGMHGKGTGSNQLLGN